MTPVVQTLTWRPSAASSIAPMWFLDLIDGTMLEVVETSAGQYRWTYIGHTDFDTETGVDDTLEDAQHSAIRAGIRAGSIGGGA
jgi:hypothetical protein